MAIPILIEKDVLWADTFKLLASGSVAEFFWLLQGGTDTQHRKDKLWLFTEEYSNTIKNVLQIKTGWKNLRHN